LTLESTEALSIYASDVGSAATAFFIAASFPNSLGALPLPENEAFAQIASTCAGVFFMIFHKTLYESVSLSHDRAA